MTSTETKSLMNPALRTFWATKSRYKVLKGGRGSSKSHDACARLTYLTKNYKIKVLAVRQFQNKITDSVYTLIKDKIEVFGYNDNFNIINNSIKSDTGSEFLFYGINRNITEIKSTENVDILYIEEAHALTKEQWDILKPTIRKANSEIWLVFNPNLETDFVYKRFVINPPKDCIVRHINYLDNPFVSETFLKEAEEAKEEDEEDYNHVYLGHPKKDDEESIIKRSWINACVDAHIKLGIEPTGAKKLGFDIADDGNDTNATILTHGILAIELDEWHGKEDELMKTSRRAFDNAVKNNAVIQYDCIGVGASAGSHFQDFNKKVDGKRIKYLKFDAGAGVSNPDKEYKHQVKNKDYFLNLKAQAWWSLADRIKETYNAVVKGAEYDKEKIISISSALPQLDSLLEQLCLPKKVQNENYKNKVESKKDLKKRGVPSPNLADAFIMAYADIKKTGMSMKQFED